MTAALKNFAAVPVIVSGRVMPEFVAAVQLEPEWQAWTAAVTVPGARVCPEPSEKFVAEICRFQPAPLPRASTTPSTGAYETVWSVPSSVAETDGLDGRLSETPAVPETVAVAVSVPANAAVAVTSANAAIAPMIKIRCLISCSLLNPKGVLTPHPPSPQCVGDNRGLTV